MISSPRNPRIVEARKLTQRKHRRQQGRFGVEGLQALHMALNAGRLPVEAFVCPALFVGEEAAQLYQRLEAQAVPCVEVSPEVIHSLSDREQSQGIFAVFARQMPNLSALTSDGLVLVLDRLQDPGNLGTIIRTADAVGAKGVILLTPAADFTDPKAIRASMGSVFNLPIIEQPDPHAVFSQLQAQGFTLIGADAHKGDLWTQSPWPAACALILGNEARGLSEEAEGYIQAWTHLPVLGQADSLNVSVAAGVLMYAWLQAHLN